MCLLLTGKYGRPFRIVSGMALLFCSRMSHKFSGVLKYCGVKESLMGKDVKRSTYNIYQQYCLSIKKSITKLNMAMMTMTAVATVANGRRRKGLLTTASERAESHVHDFNLSGNIL